MKPAKSPLDRINKFSDFHIHKEYNIITVRLKAKTTWKVQDRNKAMQLAH